MFEIISTLFHPKIRKEWDAFFPDNMVAILQFLSHNNTSPAYENPIDRCSNRNNFIDTLPQKYKKFSYKKLIENAPYQLKKFVLNNKKFVIEAYQREQHYKEVISLLDSSSHGVTSVCNKYFPFTLLGGSRIPKENNKLPNPACIVGIIDPTPSHILWIEGEKRGKRSQQDIVSIKYSSTVCYDDLDILFQELYPYCSEIRDEEIRIADLLHKQDIREQFKNEITNNERRKEYYKDFLKSQNHDKDLVYAQKEYCLQHITDLDDYISKRIKGEVKKIAQKWPLGYDWYKDINSDPDYGDRLEGNDFLFDCIKHKEIIQKEHDIILHYQVLYSQYPNAINAYKDDNKGWDDNYCRVYYPSYEDIISIGEDKLKEYESNIHKIKYHENLINSQKEYSRCCREAKDILLKSWGCNLHHIPFPSITYDGKETQKDYVVFQLYANGFCYDNSLDYTNHAYIVRNTNYLQGIKNRSKYYKKNLYDKIILFLKDLKKKYNDDLVVLIGSSGIEDNPSFNDYHLMYLRQQLSEEGFEFKEKVKMPQTLTKNAHYVIIEVITENCHLQETCQEILNLNNVYSGNSKTKSMDRFSDIIFISINKEYDSDKMQTIISEKYKETEKQREFEKKRLEEERKKEEEIQLQEILSKLQSAVSTWGSLIDGPKISYLFDYIPINYPATNEESKNRILVWDFKNTPGKTLPGAHQIALKEVISMITKKILDTFEKECLKHLTLVCIPASTQVKTKARYEEFAKSVCEETGMINAFPYISVVEERSERHLGGTCMNIDQISFDDDFFKGKFVLLFDDVITKGNSMRKIKQKMESLGATVVGGLALGKTKHKCH